MDYQKLCKVYEELEINPSRLKKTEILSDFLKELKHVHNKDIIYLLQGKVFPDYSEKEFGISEKLCIKVLSRASGISDEKIIDEWKKLGDLGKVAEIIISNKRQHTLFSNEFTTDKVLNNLQKLPELEGKGAIDKKLFLISELLTSASSKEAKYIIRTLLGELRIGVAAGTLRDAIVDSCFEKSTKENFEKYEIKNFNSSFSEKTSEIGNSKFSKKNFDAISFGNRNYAKFSKEKRKEISDAVQDSYDKTADWKIVFEQACKGLSSLEKTPLEPGKPVKVMLFLKEETIEDGFKRVGKPCLLDFKYDGFRMMISKNKNEIKIFTRRLDEVTKQFPEVKKYVKEYVKGESFILDTEAVGFDPKTKIYSPFQNISQRIKRKYDIEKIEKEIPIEVNVFDILFYNGSSFIKEPFKKRRELIEKIVKNKKYKIRTSEAIITDDIKKAYNFYNKALKAGEEGIMMKSLSAPYKPGSRVGYGIKIKPESKEFDLVIVKAEYGTGKRAGWLTSYTVACREKNELYEVGKVSTGLKEKESEGLSFKELTKKLKPIITEESGRMVHVKPEIVVTVVYQNIQSSPKYSSGFALRFPRVIRLRPDRSVESIATLNEINKDFIRRN